MKRFVVVVAISLSLSFPQLTNANPDTDDSIAGEAKNVVGSIGETLGSTVKKVGKGVVDTTDRVTGNIDVDAARKEIDRSAHEALTRLFRLDPKAKTLYDQSYGYAVFDSRKSSFLVTLGGGGGVAVAKPDNKRTYMRMVIGGANFGAGMQFFHNVFLFENKQAFERFVNSGWEAGTAANANFGRNSIDAQVRFVDGMALFQLADTGINLSADVTGTKYWKDSALN